MDCHLQKKKVFIYFKESPLKMMKNAFYFMLKARFCFETFTFLVMQKNILIRKIWLVSKFMTSQTGQQIITIEYNMRNIFFERLSTKCNAEARPRIFHKNQNWAYFWINSLKCYEDCLYCKSKSKSTKI